MWISKSRLDELNRRLDGLENRLSSVEGGVAPYEHFAELQLKYDYGNCNIKPVATISLWEMVHAIRMSIGLEISATEARPPSWSLVKRPESGANS